MRSRFFASLSSVGKGAAPEAKRSALDAKTRLRGRGPDRSVRLSSANMDATPGAKRGALGAMIRDHVLGLAEVVHLHQM